jgi:hypothetical protein
LRWQVPNVLPKSSCMGTLVLKPCFFRLYAPLRIPFKCKRAVVGKTFGIASANNL